MIHAGSQKVNKIHGTDFAGALTELLVFCSSCCRATQRNVIVLSAERSEMERALVFLGVLLFGVTLLGIPLAEVPLRGVAFFGVPLGEAMVMKQGGCGKK
jgi:hypothetical protein